ncbi:MAG: lipoprotein-releasing ABC transporter permease subunit [Hyphomicrobiaceae bacterium]
MAAERSTAPFSPFEWMLASRYLRARRGAGFISVIAGFSFLGVMLGVATLIVVMAVMNGFRAELYQKMLGLNGHIIASKIGEPFKDYASVAHTIERVPGVQAAVPLIEGQVMMSTPVKAVGALVRGMSGADIAKLPLVAGNVRYGSFDNFDDGSSIALGARLADDLGVNIGDTVTLVNPRGKSTVFGIKPTLKAYTVAVIFEIGMSEYDRTIAFMPLGEAQGYFNEPERVDVIEVMVDSPERVLDYSREIREATGPSIYLTDWQQRNETFFTVLDVERNVMFLILSLIILVAALNIISGLMMLVKDKGRDIAILRTMGATKGAVMRVFLITGASIGIVGTIAGFFLAVLIIRNLEPIRGFISWVTNTTIFDPTIYYLSRLPAKMDPVETGWIVVFAFILSIGATLYPSWRASRLDPVKALRYE